MTYIMAPFGKVITDHPTTHEPFEQPKLVGMRSSPSRIDWEGPSMIRVSGRSVWGYAFRGQVWTALGELQTVDPRFDWTQSPNELVGIVFEQVLGEADTVTSERIVLRQDVWHRLATKAGQPALAGPIAQPYKPRLIDHYRQLQQEVRILHMHLAHVFEYTDDQHRRSLAVSSVRDGDTRRYLHETLGLDPMDGTPLIRDAWTAPRTGEAL